MYTLRYVCSAEHDSFTLLSNLVGQQRNGAVARDEAISLALPSQCRRPPLLSCPSIQGPPCLEMCSFKAL